VGKKEKIVMTNYSEENMKVVKSFYDAASRGDFGPVRAALDPNVE
jgi:ketosteroid isomerase-like protein